MGLLRIFALSLSLSPALPLCRPFLHLQTPASSSARPQGPGRRGEADTDVIHSPPV